jgi:peptidoglycan/xylan/chitin deacetylase (PgdA/CDA1 family)
MTSRRTLRRITRPRLRESVLVSLTFDDGTADHVDAGRLLAALGLAGTFFVNSNLVGTGPERLGWADVADLASDGHEIGGHTSDHVDLVAAGDAEARMQIEGDRRELVQRGYEVRSFAYPYGSIADISRALAAEAGYASARRAWGLAAGRDVSRAATESVPPVDQYAIRTVPSLEHETTQAELSELVARAEREGGWLPLVFHGISGDGRYDVAESVFRDFVTWLAGRRGVSVRTVGDVVALG